MLYNSFQHSPSSWCIDIIHVQLAKWVVETFCWHSFDEYINQLIFRFRMEPYHFFFEILHDEMPVYFNMFSVVMLNWIITDIDSSFIITEQIHFCLWNKVNISHQTFKPQKFTHIISHPSKFGFCIRECYHFSSFTFPSN